MTKFDPTRPFNDPITSCCERDAADCDCLDEEEPFCNACGLRHPDGECDLDVEDEEPAGPWCPTHERPHEPGGLACELVMAENQLAR